MGEKTPATTTQQSTTNPWAPAQPLLQSLIGRFSALPTDVTGAQSSAAQNLVNSTSGMPNFGNTAAGGVQSLFNSNTTPQQMLLGGAYGDLSKNLGATASGANLDPYSTPGFGDAIKTAMGDITNQVKGTYDASGRSPSGSGSFAGSLGRGLTQGIAPVIQQQANQNQQNMFNANNTLFAGAGSTAQGITGQQQAQYGNILQGMQGAGMLSGLYSSPGMAQLSAANTQQGLAGQNLQQILAAAGLLGGMGNSSSGTGTQTPANNPLMNWMGGISAGAGLLFSDARLKTDIAPVGKLHDGQNVYSYRFKGDRTPQIGLLAQEVAQHKPEAVHKIGGALAVDYGSATSRARRIGVGLLNREAA